MWFVIACFLGLWQTVKLAGYHAISLIVSYRCMSRVYLRTYIRIYDIIPFVFKYTNLFVKIQGSRMISPSLYGAVMGLSACATSHHFFA